MLAEIVLPAGTTRVTVRDVPGIFADALHPPVREGTPRYVTRLMKLPLTEEAKRKHIGDVPLAFPISLVDDDWAELEAIWSGLPKLELPIAEDKWQQYMKAYEAAPTKGWREQWKLCPDLNNPRLNRDVLWHTTQEEYTKLLRRASLEGAIVPRNRHTLLPMPAASGELLMDCFITVEDLCKFAASLNVSVAFRVPGIRGDGGAMTRATYEEHQASLNARRSQGRYTLEEAALAIEEATGESAGEMLENLVTAARSGALCVYAPGKNARYLYKTSGFQSHVREFYEEAFWNHLNDWLEKHEPRITWRFPDPSANADEVALTNHDAAPNALPKKDILSAPWPLPNGRQLAPLLSDVPKWLEPARVSRGSPGKGSSTWNPALLADCLATTSKGKTWVVNHLALTNFLNRYFQKWAAEWEELSEYP